jgi:hypothetical protein
LTPEANAIADDIADVGETAILRRLAPQNIHFDVTVKAVDRGYKVTELTQAIVQGDREVRVSNREILTHQWPGPPRNGDQIIMGGKTGRIMGVESPKIGEEVVMHIIQVRGV